MTELNSKLEYGEVLCDEKVPRPNNLRTFQEMKYSSILLEFSDIMEEILISPLPVDDLNL